MVPLRQRGQRWLRISGSVLISCLVAVVVLCTPLCANWRGGNNAGPYGVGHATNGHPVIISEYIPVRYFPVRREPYLASIKFIGHSLRKDDGLGLRICSGEDERSKTKGKTLIWKHGVTGEADSLQLLVRVVKGWTLVAVEYFQHKSGLELFGGSLASILNLKIQNHWLSNVALRFNIRNIYPRSLIFLHNVQLSVQNDKLVDTGKSQYAREDSNDAIGKATLSPQFEESFPRAHRWLLFILSGGLSCVGIFCLLLAFDQTSIRLCFLYVGLAVLSFALVFAFAHAGFAVLIRHLEPTKPALGSLCEYKCNFISLSPRQPFRAIRNSNTYSCCGDLIGMNTTPYGGSSVSAQTSDVKFGFDNVKILSPFDFKVIPSCYVHWHTGKFNIIQFHITIVGDQKWS